MDGDRVLPADASSLMEMLDGALDGLDARKAAPAQAGITAFIDRLQALIEAGALAADDSRLPLETARAILAVLRG
jgi:hypothetical protein